MSPKSEPESPSPSLPPATSRDSSPPPSPPPAPPPSLGVVLCVERGPLEAQAVLLCESLRSFGGRWRGVPIYALAPRPGRRPGRATVAALEALEVEVLDDTLDTGSPEYGSANRVAAAAHVERIAPCELLAVLDTDTFFTAEPAAFALPPEVDAAVRPVDVKGICTSGPDDPCDPYWQQLCTLSGVPYDSLPLVTTTDGQATVRASYNGGLVVVRRRLGILGRWSEIFVASVRRGLHPWHGGRGPIRSSTGIVAPSAARWWGSNQAALALALWSSTEAVETLPAGYNYPLHLEAQLPPEHRARARAGLVHVHYHHLLDADALASSSLLQAGSPLAPEQIAWLRARTPLAPPNGSAAPTAPPRQRGRQLVVTGMHRSATSLVTSVLEKAGLEVGIDQGPGTGNPNGHYEDRDFYHLHEDLLAAAGTGCFTAEGDLLPPAGSDLAQRAGDLLAARAALPLWGWKDPRTCLFLDLWQPLLPAASYLFLYRHPLDVAMSLWRRNTDPDLQRDPLLAIRAWQLYNERLLAFCERHRERCVLAQVPTVTRDLDGLVRLLAERFRLPLRWGGLSALFAEESLTPRAGVLDALAARLFPQAVALYRRLEEAADLPGATARTGADQPAPRPEPSAAERELVTALESLLVPLLEHRGQEVARDGTLADLVRQRDELATRLHAEWSERIAVATALAAERAALAELRRESAGRAAARRNEAALLEELRKDGEAWADEVERVTARCAELETTLAEIQRARAFALVRGWWGLRRALRRFLRRFLRWLPRRPAV